MKTCLVACGALLAVALSAGCGSSPDGSPQITGSTKSPIQGGTNDTTHDFAVGIVVFPMGQTGCATQTGCPVAFCSGALLAPNLVATARHCAAAISASQIDCTTATFGADYQTNQLFVTTDATISSSSPNFVNVSKIVTPTAAPVCGNDLALLVLSTNIDLPEYVTPVLSPPMTDHTTYATAVTAIGYGITTPTDTTGTTAGTRRIRESIPLECIPNDTTFQDCFPALSSTVDAREFVVTDGTCEGDSGSSAFDQKSFDQGVWKSFGVLSRGGVSLDGMTCQGSVYTRFDQNSDLLVSTAVQAAQMGGYSPPAWTGASGSTSSSGSTAGTGSTGGSTGTGSGTTNSGGSASGSSALAADGAACSADSACASNNCISTDGTTYFCASKCSTSSDCTTGFTCVQAYCIGTSNADGGTGSSSGGKSGCSIGLGRDGGGSGIAWLVGLGVAAVAVRRRPQRGQVSGTRHG
jgi:hypothetical protein